MIINEVKVSFAKKKPVVAFNVESVNSSVTSKVSELEELKLSQDEQEKLNHGMNQVIYCKWKHPKGIDGNFLWFYLPNECL